MRPGARPVFDPAFTNSLEAFQRFVGGGERESIDVINVPDDVIAALDARYSTKFGPRACVVVLDDMAGQTEVNELASLIAGQVVLGPALFCDVP